MSFSFSLMQFQIRALESQKRQQEIVLRRKTQEVGEERGFPPHSPQLPWRSGPQCLAQRNPILQTGLALGMRFPKGKEGFYGSGTGWEMVVGSSRIPHPEQQSLVAGVGCEGGEGNP